jgi:hypothetical protein
MTGIGILPVNSNEEGAAGFVPSFDGLTRDGGIDIIIKDKGTEQSGNHGHAGRPGKVGGSAPSGGKMVKGQNYKDMGTVSIKKSIRSHMKQAEKHINKIKRPEDVYQNWELFEENRREGILSHWKEELRGFNAEIELGKTELKARGESDGTERTHPK